MPHADPAGFVLLGLSVAFIIAIRLINEVATYISVEREGRKSQRYFNSRPSARGDGKRYAISANLLFNPYKSAWLNNSATQFVEIILVIFHRIIV